MAHVYTRRELATTSDDELLELLLVVLALDGPDARALATEVVRRGLVERAQTLARARTAQNRKRLE